MTTICVTTTAHETIRVLLVDDTEAVRRALGLMLGAEPDLSIIGEAEDGARAVLLAQELHPDVILLDLVLPDMSGIEAARRITMAGETGAMMILTAFGGDEARNAATAAGIALFLEKGETLDDLAEKIRALHGRNIPA